MSKRKVDPFIEDIIDALNREDLVTTNSCSGHEGETEGYILFDRKYSHSKVRGVLKDFGVLRDIIIRDYKNPWYPSGRTRISFKPLGGPSIGIPTEDPYETLPTLSEGVSYFRRGGASSKEARGLTLSLGVREKV